jgi:hypothetical protein
MRRWAGQRWADLGRRLGSYLLLRAAGKREGEAGWPETAQQGRGKERGSVARFEQLQGVTSAWKRQAGGGEASAREPPRSSFASWRKKKRQICTKALGFGGFSGILKTEQVLYCLVIQTSF